MASQRLTHRLLAAIAEYRESEKELPEGVDALLTDVITSLSAEPSAQGDEGDAARQDRRQKAAAKFREATGDKPAADKTSADPEDGTSEEEVEDKQDQ